MFAYCVILDYLNLCSFFIKINLENADLLLRYHDPISYIHAVKLIERNTVYFNLSAVATLTYRVGWDKLFHLFPLFQKAKRRFQVKNEYIHSQDSGCVYEREGKFISWLFHHVVRCLCILLPVIL